MATGRPGAGTRHLALTAVNRQKFALKQHSARTIALQAAILENAAYAVIATDINGSITFFNRAAEHMLGYRSDVVVDKATPAIFHDPAKVRSRAALSPLGIHLQSMDGRYLETNDAFLSIVGYNRDGITKMTCYDLMPEEYLHDEPRRLQRLRDTGIIPTFEKAYRRRDGTLVPISTLTVLVSGPDGQEFKWTIVEDITIRRQAEEAQRRLKNDLERLVAERMVRARYDISGYLSKSTVMRQSLLSVLETVLGGAALDEK